MPQLLLLVAVVRLVLGVLAMSSSAQEEATGHAATPPHSVYWAMIVWAVAPISCVLWCVAVLQGDVTRLPWLALGLVLLFPWWLARRVLVPLGLWRSAYAVTRLSAFTWRGDTKGGATMAAAWAVLRSRRARPGAVTWILARRDELGPLRGGGILATALVAELRDDTAGMLALTKSVLQLAHDPRHFAARGLATQWLAAHATSAGDWAQVDALTQAVTPLPPEARLLGFIARGRLHGVQGPLAAGRLLAAWLLAPQRHRTWAVVAQTLRSPATDPAHEHHDAADPEPSENDPAPDSGLPRRAVTAHARLTAASGETVSATQLAQVALAWEKALGSEALRQFMLARATAVGARRVDPLAAARAQVVEDLAQILRQRRATVGDNPPLLLAEANLRVESAATDEVEACWAPIERRRHDGDALSAVDEWREFVALQAAYATAVAIRGEAGRRLLFDETDTVVSHLAARLWNDRQELSIANAMFAWLLPQAEAAQDDEAVRRLRRNIRGGL